MFDTLQPLVDLLASRLKIGPGVKLFASHQNVKLQKTERGSSKLSTFVTVVTLIAKDIYVVLVLFEVC